jgi:hypothetical protein
MMLSLQARVRLAHISKAMRFSQADTVQLIGVALSISVGVLAAVLSATKSAKQAKESEQKIEVVEQRVRDNPKEPQLAWELARVKLESYLNRHLSQVRSIFILTVFVMAVGFALIGVGASEAFREPGRFKASVLSSISGVLVSFIGGTFLVLYKSTMAQAKDYVTILERINAVGMSVQILELLDEGDEELKHQTTAAVALQLLHMYSHNMPEVGAVSRAKRKGRRRVKQFEISGSTPIPKTGFPFVPGRFLFWCRPHGFS